MSKVIKVGARNFYLFKGFKKLFPYSKFCLVQIILIFFIFYLAKLRKKITVRL